MKIDVTKIEGYESMSAEEKLEALTSYEFDTKGYVKKEQFDKVSSEIASLKKERKEQMSETERKEAEREELLTSMQQELDSLREEKRLSELTSKYLSLGFENELAMETAKAFIKGDMDKVFNNQKAHQDSLKEKIKLDLLKDTPAPGVQEPTKTMTKETLRKMPADERFKFATSHPDEYRKIYEGE